MSHQLGLTRAAHYAFPLAECIRNLSPSINTVHVRRTSLNHIPMMPYYNNRGPSRILWFIIGAVTTNWLLRPKNSDSRIFGHCRRLQYQTPPPNSSVPDGGSADGAPSAPNPWSVTVRDTINNIPYSGSEQQLSWQQEKEHLADISRKVADAMTDLTEATLESVLSAAEDLKAKLAEHRANRERQQSIIEQRQETPNSQPPV